MDIFEQVESSVQSYAQSFPVVFDKAQGSYLYDVDGKAYLDFLAGAGTLNYGHNNPHFKKKLLEYIEHDGIAHGLDLHTRAKEEFLTVFNNLILEPRNMDYVVQFTGPTGTNTVEAAFKIARNVTGRHNIIAFTNGFHGVSLGAMSATGNEHHRGAAGIPLTGVTHMPYDNYLGQDCQTLDLLEAMLSDPSSGIDPPAAAIVETVQGEGGLNVASNEWLRRLEKICRQHEMLLIVDDIQAGCGRTGTFFSFEPARITPDIITLSKSLSGFGLPFAVTLIKPEYDLWKPGEHNGTFRGNNHAFVTATEAIKRYWSDDAFAKNVQAKSELLGKRLHRIADTHGHDRIQAKGRGMMQGLNCPEGELAFISKKICQAAFEKGLIIETSGSEDQVVKCLCPLTISEQELNEGLDILSSSVFEVMGETFSKAC
jgi:diaminobutyrate-2-oxoglutarate transaminase